MNLSDVDNIKIIYPWSFKMQEFEVNLKVYLKGA